MSMGIVLFNLFSTIEGVALFSIMLHLFRYKVTTYFKEIIIFSFIMSVLSYFIREDIASLWLAPVFMVLLSIAFMYLVVRIQLFWACVVVFSGYAILVITQLSLVLIFTSLGVVTLENIESNTWNTYFIQSLEFAIIIPSSLYFYKRGYGFAYSFDRFRWKKDNVLFLGLMTICVLAFSFILTYKNLFAGVFILLITVLCLILMSLRKEKRE
jgi:preprotein translocase subunit Sec61beta